MRFVAISDTHLAEPDLPDGDVLIHAGDLTYRGNAGEVAQAAYWLGRQRPRFKHIVVVAGNHDWLFQRDPETAKKIMDTNGLTYLQDSCCIVQGIKIWGSPWQPEFCNWAFNLPRGKPLKEKWDMIPIDTDILVTHGPPYGILDRVPTFHEELYPDDSSIGHRYVGCRDLNQAVAMKEPRVHVFGHVHASYGVLDKGYCKFINAAIMSEAYHPRHKPIVFELEPANQEANF